MFKNEAKTIRYIVKLSFVLPDGSDGYMRTGISNAPMKEVAIVEVLSNHMDESYPLAGVSVHELVASF